MDLPNIFTYQALDEPSAQLTKKVRSLEDKKTFDAAVGSSSTGADLSSALMIASSVLTDAGLKKCFKRVHIYTCNDTPDGGDINRRAQAIQKVKDMEEFDIDIELFRFKRPQHEFDVTQFWDQVIRFDPADGAESYFAETLEDMKASFKAKMHKKRALGSVPFEIADGVQIGVKLYVPFRRAEPERGYWLDRKSNTKLSTMTSWIDGETGTVLEDYQMAKFHPYGGVQVEFTDEEMTTIKTFGAPGLTLMGFKDEDTVEVFHQVKASYFIYPDEHQFEGSTVAFHALSKSMTKLKKVAIARIIVRKVGAPRFVALVPQMEVLNEYGAQEQAPGMHMIFLPFADDIRSLVLDPTAIADDAKVKAASHDLIKAIQIDVEDDTFSNPYLQKHYAALQALALDEDVPDFVDDDLMPDYEGFKTKQDKLTAYKEAVKSIVPEPVAPAPKSRKRKAPAESKSPSKRAKAAADADIDFKKLAALSQLKQLTVPKLKGFLSSVGERVTGRKADLITRIEAYFQKND